jgi:syntaxin 16
VGMVILLIVKPKRHRGAEAPPADENVIPP